MTHYLFLQRQSLALLSTQLEEGTSIREEALFLISPGHSQRRRRASLREP